MGRQRSVKKSFEEAQTSHLPPLHVQSPALQASTAGPFPLCQTPVRAAHFTAIPTL